MYTSVSLLALVASVSAQGITLTGACLNGPCAPSSTASFLTGACLNGPCASATATASFITGACLNGPCGTTTSSNAASSTSITAIALGQTCDPFGTPCANGAQCFNKESRRIHSCGNYMAACTSDLQCANNLCVSGLCSGEKSGSGSTIQTLGKSSTTSVFLTAACPNGPCTAATPTGTSLTGACLNGPCSAATSTATGIFISGACLNGPCGTATSAQTTPTALTGTLPVGSLCVVGSNPCADGSQCYASKSDLQTICGNYGAVCTKDSQCAFNVCANGFCGGWKSSTIGGKNTTTPTTVAPAPPGFTTSFTVIDGKTSSALVNSAGSTTAFGTAAATATGGFTAGAGKVGTEVKGLVMAIAIIVGAIL
ncbi:hypothetical protein B0J14DRAFT_645059 [Halenospora varia]|nr:hypothetical protein B0J14DRAFT_645059 [Halenospora varia]